MSTLPRYRLGYDASPSGVTRGAQAADRYAEADARRMAHLDALIRAGKGDKRQTQPAPARAIQTPTPVSHKAPTPKTRQRGSQGPSRASTRNTPAQPKVIQWHRGLKWLSDRSLRSAMDAAANELRRRARARASGGREP